MALTPKQAQFVREYLIDLNATQAAIRTGYSPKTAVVQGARLLTNANVAAAVQEGKDARAKRTEITADMVLKEFAKIGFSDIRNVMTWDEESSTFVPSKDLDDNTAAIVSGVKSKTRTVRAQSGETETTVELELKTYDKVQALTQMGRHLGMFNQPIEVDDITGLTPDERANRVARLRDALRARRDREAGSG